MQTIKTRITARCGVASSTTWFSSECSTMMEATKRRTIGSVPPSLSRVGPFKRRNARESVIPLLFFCVCCVACCGAEKSHDENSHPTSHTVLLGNSRREGELKNSHAPIRRANIFGNIVFSQQLTQNKQQHKTNKSLSSQNESSLSSSRTITHYCTYTRCAKQIMQVFRFVR